MSDKCKIIKKNKVKDNHESLGKNTLKRRPSKSRKKEEKNPKHGYWPPILKEIERQLG
jgi:hypothetical protein